MSTFKGIIAEFPQIRVDYFRLHAEQRAPLACFLSHVHSDHLIGLESLRAPFVYCSAATREILLRLEKYHYRLNFAKGILESRNVTYSRSMHKLAKPLPLDTPTVIELAPGNSIRVTLIDANHCVGAVMFLFEGNGKAVLYTGDIRGETWWLNGLTRNPVLIPYTIGSRRLNCIYLDTTFAIGSKPYQEFPSKAEGIRELLEKVGEYDDDTLFYFHSWTFGYEDVWIALSAFLDSQIHLDAYRARLYGSLSTLDKRQLKEVGLSVQSENKHLKESGLHIREGPALCGFRNGNHIHPGCLTSRESVRIHSCERGMGCRVMDNDKGSKIVHIIPIITRSEGMEIAELGAGGGKGDLDQKEELETGDVASIGKLMELCTTTITDEARLSKTLATLQQMLKTQTSEVSLNLHLQKTADTEQDDISIHNLVSALSSTATKEPPPPQPANRTIRFPYSRHSSYSELRALVAAFQPNDVYPCTVDEETWTPDTSMQRLFGDCCSGTWFRHDAEMHEPYTVRAKRDDEKRKREESQHDTQTTEEQAVSSPGGVEVDETVVAVSMSGGDGLDGTRERPIAIDDGEVAAASSTLLVQLVPSSVRSATSQATRPAAASKRRRITNQQIAYDAAIGAKLTWADYGGLESTRRREDREEEEL